jgi:hypothetical protein
VLPEANLAGRQDPARKRGDVDSPERLLDSQLALDTFDAVEQIVYAADLLDLRGRDRREARRDVMRS